MIDYLGEEEPEISQDVRGPVVLGKTKNVRCEVRVLLGPRTSPSLCRPSSSSSPLFRFGAGERQKLTERAKSV